MTDILDAPAPILPIRGAPSMLMHSILGYTGAKRVREVLVCGPGGTGKSFGILCVIADLALQFPGIHILLCRKTRRSMSQSTLWEWEKVLEHKCPEALSGPSREGRSVYTFPNTTEVAIGGLDDAYRLFSTSWDIIYYEELVEGTLDEWELFRRGMRNWGHPGLRELLMLASCNPDDPNHWVKKRAEAGLMDYYESWHHDNPKYHDGVNWTEEGAAYVTGLSQLTGVRRKRIYEGQWCAAEGMVYDCWDEACHLVTGRVYQAKGQTYVHPADQSLPTEIAWTFGAVDWGYDAPGVFQVWGADRERRMWMLAEIYRTREGLDWWADRCAEFYREFDLRSVVADPSRPDAIDAFNKRIALEAGRDMPGFCIKADNKRGTATDFGGIDVMRSLLARRIGNRPQMMFLRDSLRHGTDEAVKKKGQPTTTAAEATGYVYEIAKDGKPNRDMPDPKCPDHGMDAARYAAMFFDKRDLTESRTKPRYAKGSIGAAKTWPGGIDFEEWWEGMNN